MDTLPASAFSLSELTDSWNLGYADYFVPLRFTEGILRQHFRAGDIDLERSVVLVEAGALVGFSFLGVRGRRGWIGGLGVAPAYRGRGLSSAVLEAQLAVVRAAGLAVMQLEVLTQNWAQKVYARAGFAVTRRLVKLAGSLPGAPGLGGVGSASAARVSDRAAHDAHHARLHEGFPACWQREQAALRAVAEPVEVIRTGPPAAPTGVLLFREQPGQVRIVDGAALGEAEADALVAALAARQPGAPATLGNEPEGSPLHRALLRAGLQETFAQYEMCWPGGGAAPAPG